MLGISLLFAILAVLLVCIRIFIEEYYIENQTGYWIESVTAALAVLGHYIWLNYFFPNSSIVFLHSFALLVWYWSCSNGLTFLGKQIFNCSDDISQLSPYWMMIVFLGILLWFIPTEGIRILGFPRLFQGQTLYIILILLSEAIFLALHLWLYIDWDWEKSAQIFHWVLSSAALLGCFAIFSTYNSSRSLVWIMVIVLAIMLHLERITGLIWLGLGWEILPLTQHWYSQELGILGIQLIIISIIYIMPTIVQILQKIIP